MEHYQKLNSANSINEYISKRIKSENILPPDYEIKKDLISRIKNTLGEAKITKKNENELKKSDIIDKLSIDQL
jgi:hypothetical protein